ncbi:Malonyl CoA-acyl carrier protein transacylase [Sphingomonas guangdongensis]|uniref:Malonyl CoA-acyl carrier protein transacylase n=1 Tax=Sphingomonas guangdongensis TaxID=1141890 RepID=A0A285QX23_9SPHN|nr:acyl carrier protein [Sphingomonas guangdongensis]SOB86525.1 Malonyl CoA-acyl carrier protein transacylase [Sphingomonas guangdongensis]
MARETLLLVCPGRGSYGKAELGSLARSGADLSAFDAIRRENGRATLAELDGAERFSPGVHLAGPNAAPLIYAGGIADAAAIDRDRYEVVAVTGNSMGWYTTLAVAGAVGAEQGFRIADAMGVNSGRHGAGGQLVLRLLDDAWRPVPALRERLLALAETTGCALSIDLGGALVIAGPDEGLRVFADRADVETTRLAGHGPFHTLLMAESSAAAVAELPAKWFGNPDVPLIDGRGHIWRRWASEPVAMWRYTFEAQILQAYDFALALTVALREFAPDRVVLLGPGDVLGGAIAQMLVDLRWLGMASREGFAERQASDPFLLSMARPEQRTRLIAP